MHAPVDPGVADGHRDHQHQRPPAAASLGTRKIERDHDVEDQRTELAERESEAEQDDAGSRRVGVAELLSQQIALDRERRQLRVEL